MVHHPFRIIQWPGRRQMAIALLLTLMLIAGVVSETFADSISLTLGSSDGLWANARWESGAPPSCLQYNNTPPVDDENQVAYGRKGYSCPPTIDLSQQSGFGFDGSAPPSFAFASGEVFLVGTLTHYNRPIQAPTGLRYVDLRIDLTFSEPPIATSLTYTLRLDETLNQPPCTYPGNTPCPDKVDFTDTIPDQVFGPIDGKYYTLQIVGFAPGVPGTCQYVPGQTINQFITEENQENHACLFGQVLVAAPAITVEKNPDVQQVRQGGTANFEFTVRNEGNADLANVSVTDTLAPDCERTIGTLAAGDSVTYTCSLANVTDDLTNSATATGVYGDSTYSDDDTAFVDVIHPSIAIAKTPDTQTIASGGTATFTIVVTNTGDVALSNVLVTDAQAPGCAHAIGDLAAGAGTTYTCTHSNVTADFTNSATASGTPPVGADVSASDTAFVDVAPTPADVVVTKTADPTSLPEPGGDVQFSVVVHNNAVEPLTLTALVDDVYGDLNGRGTCAVPQTIPLGGAYSCAFTAPVTGEPGTYTDVITATLVDNEENEVEDSDDATVTLTDVVPTPDDVVVTKTADPTSLPEPGGVFTFTLIITNQFVEPLTITSLDDTYTLSAECNALIGTTLAPNQSVSCRYTAAHTETGSYDNTVIITLTDNEGHQVSDEDSETVEVTDAAPAVTIEKTASAASLPEPGGLVTFTLTVTNDAVEPVTITVLTDSYPLSAECLALLGQTLNAGASVSCQYTVELTGIGSHTNIATVTVEDNDDNPTTDSDTETVNIAAIRIDKTANPTVIHAGDVVAYAYAVTNPGNTPLSNVSVSDDTCSPVTYVSGDANSNNRLDAGETWTYACTTQVTQDTTNTATVTGVDSGGAVVTAQDTAFVDVIHPAIDIEASGPALAHEGDTLTYQVAVTNTGDTPLSVVVPLPDGTQWSGTLNAGESATFTATDTVLPGNDPHVVTFTATGTDPIGGQVADSDSVSTDILHPAILVTITAPISVTAGSDIPYVITVTNTGDAVLYNVVVTDSQTGFSWNGTLAVGETQTFVTTYHTQPADTDTTIVNIASATGVDALGLCVSDTDSAFTVVMRDDDRIPDADGDGLPDNLEGTGDADGDGTPDYRDMDTDEDGIPDFIEGAGDSDGDGTPDYRDMDTDSDNIPDAIEGIADTDGDGTPDYRDLDSDGDGIPDAIEGIADTDGDSTPDYRDLDSDDDGIPDAIEGWADTDGDGTPDYRDLDSDGDSIPDAIEGWADTDGDGTPDYRDLDSDGDSIPDAIEGWVDTDGDRTPDYRDLDSDGDSIPDATEGTRDTDGDGTPDFRDLDSDNDGILDAIEGTADVDGDGASNYRDLDSDGDGILDSQEYSTGPDDPLAGCTAGGDICFNNDADGDGAPNYLDTDSDGDDLPDAREGLGDDDRDGIPNYLDPARGFKVYLPLIMR